MIPLGLIGGLVGASRMWTGAAPRKASPYTVNIVLRIVLLSLGLPLAFAVFDASRWGGAPVIALVVAASLPMLFLRAVLIPLGLPRVAYCFAMVSPPLELSSEVRAGGALMAALAIGRQRVPSTKAIRWLDQLLARVPRASCMWMAAAGLLAAARGRPETTRRLFHAIDFVSLRSPRLARRIARCWLVADAAQHGDWKEVAALGRRRGWRSAIRWPFAMGTIARRLTFAQPSPSNLELSLVWLMAPHRIATLPLLHRAFDTPRHPVSRSVPPAGIAPGHQALDAALLAHARCLECPTEASVVAAGRAWDAVLSSDAVRSLFARRALALEAGSEGAAFTKLLATVQSDLAPVVAGVPADIVASSSTLEGAARDARRRAMDEIESLATNIARRTSQKSPLHASGEWMEWGAMRRLCERTIRDAAAEVRRTVFSAVYNPACNYAVWLFNVRGEKVLANSIFQWLLVEARATSDTAARTLLEKNVKAGDGL